MAHEGHEAIGRMRTVEEVRAEIKGRQDAIKALELKLVGLNSESQMWKAIVVSRDLHFSIIAVLRWVLGEDMLWE